MWIWGRKGLSKLCRGIVECPGVVKLMHVYLRAVRSPGTKCVQFIKENHTRRRISRSLKYLPDSSLTLTYILRYDTKKMIT